MSNDPMKFCKKILPEVSRSFALTIPMLDKELYEPVMVTYLQDRLLDNFEDEIKDLSYEKRTYLMDNVVQVFNPYNSEIEQPISEVETSAHLLTDKPLKMLTENVRILREAYDQLEEEIKYSSYKWLLEMNKGMKKYLKIEVETFNDLDEYCYYVAGTVGGFLTESVNYISQPSEKDQEVLLSNFKDAGSFLQKVNLVRDIRKDIRGREKNFWPLKSLGLTEEMLLNSDYKNEAMAALEKMVESIKSHIEGLVNYLEVLPETLPGYRRFFMVNNALGLTTLEKMQNNPDLFYQEGKIKVSKWEMLNILKSPEDYFYEKSRLFLALN